MKSTYALINPQIRRHAAEAVFDAPDNWLVEIRPRGRTLEQNALLHTMLSRISDSILWANEKQDIETWKRLLTAAWCRANGETIKILPAVDGMGVDIVFRRTSEMTVNELNDLIEYVHFWMAEHDISL